MEHHTPRNRARRSSSGYQASFQGSSSRYPLEDDSPRTVYVSNLTNDITNEALYDAFTQYGLVESIMRRSVSFELCAGSGQQYAFIRYRAVKDARFVINLGDITVQGRKLSVRPRDKPMMSPTGGRGGKAYYANGANRIMEMLQKGGNPQQIDAQFGLPDPTVITHPAPGMPRLTAAVPVPLEHAVQTSLHNRILTIANIPPDMPPADLYALFSRYGSVEGSYIFPHPDPFGRRFGQIAMATPYDAQKAFEGLNGASIRGHHPLEITNKSTIMFNMQQGAIPSVPAPAGFASPPYAQSHAGSQFIQPVSLGHNPIMHPDMRWNEGMTMHAQDIPNSVHGNIAEVMAVHPHFNMGLMPPFVYEHGVPMAAIAPSTLSADPESIRQQSARAVSGSSSATLVSSNLERNARQMMALDNYNNNVRYIAHPEHGIVGFNPAIKGQPFGYGKLDSEVDTEHRQRDTDSHPISASVATSTQYIPETTKPYDPSNLYVKNLDDQCIINTEDLKNLFNGFGQIASAFLATYPTSGISKGFGFVAFASPSDAAKAKSQLDGQVVGRKRIFITYAERKEDRIQRLKAIFEGRSADGSVTSTPVSQAVKAVPPEIKSDAGAPKEDVGGLDKKVTTTDKTDDNAKMGSIDQGDSSASEKKISPKKAAPFVVGPISDESCNTTPSDEKDELSYSSGEVTGSFESDESGEPMSTERKVTVTRTVTVTRGYSRLNAHEGEEDERSQKDQTLHNRANIKEQSRQSSFSGRSVKHSQDVRFHNPEPSNAEAGQHVPIAMHYQAPFVGNPTMLPFGSQGQQRPANNNGFFEKRRGRGWRAGNQRNGNNNNGNNANGGEARHQRQSPDRGNGGEWVERAADVNRFGFNPSHSGNYQHSRSLEGSKPGDNANSQGGITGTPPPLPTQRKKWKNRSYSQRVGNSQEPGAATGGGNGGGNHDDGGVNTDGGTGAAKKVRPPKRGSSYRLNANGNVEDKYGEGGNVANGVSHSRRSSLGGPRIAYATS